MVGHSSGSGGSKGIRGLETYCHQNALEGVDSILWGVENKLLYVSRVGSS